MQDKISPRNSAVKFLLWLMLTQQRFLKGKNAKSRSGTHPSRLFSILGLAAKFYWQTPPVSSYCPGAGLVTRN
jgi:hypothetical protein